MKAAWHSKLYDELVEPNSPEWNSLCKRRFLVDDYRCVYCGTPAFATKRKALAIHHIDYSQDLLNINNCISICDKCHGILHGRIQPWPGDVDPRSKEAQERLHEYLAWTRQLIAGEVWRENSIVSGNSGPDAYKQYAENNQTSTLDQQNAASAESTNNVRSHGSES